MTRNRCFLIDFEDLNMQMLIKGIRSFSPDNTAVVEFYRPLTLIIGHNGAGKTVSLGLSTRTSLIFLISIETFHYLLA